MLGSKLSGQSFINPKQLFIGFSEPVIFTIAALFIVARAVRIVGLIDSIANIVLKGVTSSKHAILRVCLPLVGMSSFLNNTPIVAIFLPVLRKWSIQNKISPSKLLIPLSYLTIFGGLCTQLGTSTNLMLKGLSDEAGIVSFGIIDLAWVGLPASIFGIAYLYFFSAKILPGKDDILEDAKTEVAKHLLEMKVENNSPLIGKSIHDAHLRNLKDIFLFEVRREDKMIAPVKSNFVLDQNDILVFSGDLKNLNHINSLEGLKVHNHNPQLEIPRDSVLIEVIISPTSPLKGKTLKDVYFNRSYNAVVLSIQRGGEAFHKHYNNVLLNTGDTLLLLAGKGFRKIWQNRNDFLFVTPNREDLFDKKKAAPVLLMSLLMVLMPLCGLIDIVYTACFTAVSFIWLKIIDSKEVVRIVDWSVLIVIASSFGLSAALVSSGTAGILSSIMISLSSTVGLIGLLALIYLFTNILTEMVSNNAAAALLFPIALECSTKLNVSPTPFIIAITIAASASFATPIGYQTNTLVYGPGRYTYKDFFKIGLPLNILYFIMSLTIIPLVWKF